MCISGLLPSVKYRSVFIYHLGSKGGIHTVNKTELMRELYEEAKRPLFIIKNVADSSVVGCPDRCYNPVGIVVGYSTTFTGSKLWRSSFRIVAKVVIKLRQVDGFSNNISTTVKRFFQITIT